MLDANRLKVAFYSYDAASLVHGGFQIQIEQTMLALRELGCDICYLEWWNPNQHVDIIHFFGRPHDTLIHYAHRKGTKVVFSDLLTAQGSRSPIRLMCQEFAGKLVRSILPVDISRLAGWTSFREADAVIALTKCEKSLMCRLYGAVAQKIHVIPNGVDAPFLSVDTKIIKSRETGLNKPLLCVATITPRKRVLELAKAAVKSQLPIQFVGRPYSETDKYYLDFLHEVEKSKGIIRYLGSISDRNHLASIYKSSRGFVLVSSMESLSLAALEAASCGLPLLLSDLPWAREVFGKKAAYVHVKCNESALGDKLKLFYNKSNIISESPITPISWRQVAIDLLKIYNNI